MAHVLAADPTFINESDLSFADISSERWREYRFAGGDAIRIEQPLKLHVSESRGHRIFDAEGRSHYIPWGWIHLSWEAKDGAPNFVR
ncbi:hypothetical protein [Sphingomonas bacterium]|uniref:hypothetical protein n=1 Tax=Sphingomonas bacterium TaxID=1895847 RepID=UPI001576CF98|nr:hypothetical protein [Sphingomonas bacterium]